MAPILLPQQYYQIQQYDHHLRLYQYNHNHVAKPISGYSISVLPKTTLPTRMKSQWKAHIILAIYQISSRIDYNQWYQQNIHLL